MSTNRLLRIIISSLALLCLIFLFVGGPDTESPRYFRYGWGQGHLLCFALWGYLFIVWRPQQSFWKQLCIVSALAILVGATTELLQTGLNREASWSDLASDLLGSLIAVVFLSPARHNLRRQWRLILQLPILAAAIWSLSPFGIAVVDDIISSQQFPLLSGFETPLETTRWGGRVSKETDPMQVKTGTASMRVDLSTQRYSGTGLKHFPRDWSAYQQLQLQLYNPAKEELKIHLRIHDFDHHKFKNAYRDRFSTSVILPSGWTTLTIPLAKVAAAPRDRRMDMTRIAGFGLFVVRLPEPRTIFIDEVRLLL